MAIEYTEITYITYNYRNVFTTSIILFLYLFFISRMYLAIKFEILNKRNKCDVRYYYSKPCRNEIANNILFDPTFLDYKKRYFTNIETNISPNLDTTISFSEVESRKIDKNETVHKAKVENATSDVKSQFQIAADSLQVVVASILGNLNSVVNAFTIQNTDILSGLTNLKDQLPTPSGAIADALNPSVAKIVSPLQKLYKSLTNTPSAQ